MTPALHQLPAPALALAMALLLMPCAAAQTTPAAAIGELMPDYTFKEFLALGDGRQRLSEFRGQPVLIVNWTDTDFGRGAANQAEKLAAELVDDGLISILLDTHNKSGPAIEASVMRLYPGNRSRLTRTQKPPISYLDNGPPPDIALIGVDGRLLIAGSYTVDFGKASKLVKAEMKKLRSGWGEHKTARAIRAAAFGKRDLAGAHAMAVEALAEEPTQPELLQAHAEVLGRQQTWAASVGTLLERGRCQLALIQARGLSQAVAGHEDWEAQAAELLAHFETDELEDELARDKKLSALLKRLEKKKPRAADVKKLETFAATHADTRVGRRARHLAEIAALASGRE